MTKRKRKHKPGNVVTAGTTSDGSTFIAHGDKPMSEESRGALQNVMEAAAKQMRTMNPEIDADWLRKLNAEIWQEHPRSATARFAWADEKRVLTQEELARVLELAKSGTYIVGMWNACMGFGVGISLYASPLYPGTDPEPLIAITNKHISKDARFEDGWKLFSPIALSEENQRAYEFACGERLRTEKHHYDY